jgi:hypothetical protein
MTAPALAARWNHPVRAAVPPFTAEGLQRVLEKLRSWQPYVDGSLLDDVAAVLDDYMPIEAEIDDMVLRLRGHLTRLVDLAVSAKVVGQDPQVGETVRRARTIRQEELPGDHRRAVGHIRRMAWTLDGLLELLVANQCLKEAT